MLSSNPNVPDELIMALYHSIIVCLEFVIGTLEHSFLPSELGNLPKDINEMLAGVGGTAESEEKRCLGPWSVAFYSDDKHVLKEIARQVRDALGVSLETAEQLSKEAEQIVSVLMDGPGEGGLIVGAQSRIDDAQCGRCVSRCQHVPADRSGCIPSTRLGYVQRRDCWCHHLVVQRYVPDENRRRWRYLSPVTSTRSAGA